MTTRDSAMVTQEGGWPTPSFLLGGGEMGLLIRTTDWSGSPLGPPEGWPQSLKTAIRIMLTSRQPIWIGWGPALIFFYNDAYKSIIGGRHPDALGRPTAVIWREIWDEIKPLLATALTGTEGIFVEQKQLIMERNGYPEETYYTFSYSPIPDDDGGTGGIICANSDDTLRVVGERQLSLLRDLATSTADARSTADACTLSMRALESNPLDLPFAMLYLAEPGSTTVSLAGIVGIAPGHEAAPSTMLPDGEPAWPFADALRGQDIKLLSDLSAYPTLPSGGWALPPRHAAILPILPSGETARAGVLIVGLNPCRVFDDRYAAFLKLVAGQIGAAIGYAQAYENERRRAEALAELDAAKTTFFSNISHEFRTPLTLMLGPLEELIARHHAHAATSDGSAPTGRIADHRAIDGSDGTGGTGGTEADDIALLDITHRNGLRLLKLVNALLDFSRIEAGRVHLQPEPTDLRGFTLELASLFRSAIETAGLELVLACDPLPAAVRLDREVWEKIVLNLLSNAFKFTLAGSIRVDLHTTPDEGIAFSVADTGIGIAAAELPRLFERFHRVPGATGRSIEGSGIGLALVQELVKLQGGTLHVDSEPGVGTRFTVTLPATLFETAQQAQAAATSNQARAYVDAALRWNLEASDSPPAAFADAASVAEVAGEVESDAASAMPGARMRTRLLVVDDNADLRDYMQRILRAAGHDVTLAADGREALDAMRAFRPDLVLSDVMMPRLDGFGLLREIRADAVLRDTPVLLLSARAGEEARVGGLESGANDYLIKPFSARELLARVASNLQLARLRRETELRLSEESRTLETLNRVGAAVAAELDLDRAVQVVTDAATELTGAAFGSFFYNVLDGHGGSYMLYTLSGVPKEAFANFPMPRNTAVFAPTFGGEGIVRADDITQDPRYGHSAPHHGMPEGHLKVRSYLAASVVSRSGDVLGGLFFGHPEPGVFTARDERIVAGIAAQAAIAIDNARLYQAAQSEIAGRTNAQAALRELNETLELRVQDAVADRERLWDLSEDLLVVADFEGKFQRLSPSWTRVLGHDIAWLLSHNYLTLIHPADLAGVGAHLLVLKRAAGSVKFENRVMCADGAWRWLAWTLSVDPATGLMHGVGRDVTADKDREEALRLAEDALRAAAKMEAIGKLTGGVAHDFNNLLQVIGGNLQLLSRDMAGRERAEQHVRNALAGVARGAKLASQLLSFSRRQPLAPKVVNLGRFIRGLDDMLRRALGDGIEIETVVSGGLWNTLIDPFQVENALLNLAINARDAMSGHGRMTIEAGNASLDDIYVRHNADVTPGQYVMVAVTDFGSGMAPEVRERVFEPFFTTKPEGEGTGLGLSMVYGFVKQSGGHIKIYSEPGMGTTVRIYLPREQQEEDRETEVDPGPADGGSETILVVEDDEDVRATVVEMLLQLGYRVLKARDAQSALAIVESGVQVDLLFSDVVMPGVLRSPELARKVRERLPGVAVLFTSGYTDNAIVHSGRLDPGIELLSKPYTLEAMARKIRRVLLKADVDEAEAVDARGARLSGGAQGDRAAALSVASGGGRKRVLFVEDDELVRASTAELLRTFDVEVIEVGDEANAMQVLDAHAFDILLTDVGLRGASGIDLAMAAKRLRPRLRVIFLSGYDIVLTEAQRAVLPDALSLRKPYDLAELIAALG